MELRQLNSFCQIVQCGNLKDAAKRCFLTPSAVSQQIKTLEQELESKLFELKGRKLTLTSKGEVFHCDAKKILDSVQEAGAKAKAQTDDFSGTISLAAPGRLRYFYLPSFARFRAAYPSIKLTILARSHADAIAMVRSGDADLAMGLFPHSFVDLAEVPLITPNLTLVIPRQGVSLTAKNVGLKELSQQPMVLLQSFTTTRAVIDGAFRKKNLNLRTEMEASTCVEVKRYVTNAVGLGIVHDIGIEPEYTGRFRTINLEKLSPTHGQG
jgi:DNA-binding transcriptional LysR family regulator